MQRQTKGMRKQTREQQHRAQECLDYRMDVMIRFNEDTYWQEQDAPQTLGEMF